MKLRITKNPELWYAIGALWGDPCFCISKGIYHVDIYEKKEFCKRFVQSLFQVYGIEGHVYFNRSTSCYVGILRGKGVEIKEIYQDLNRFGPYDRDSWNVPGILYEGAKICKVKSLQGYFDAEGCVY